LKVGDFDAAVRDLRDANLIRDHRDGSLIALADGIGSDKVVRYLVDRDMPVFEITKSEETLEQFYLRLMSANGEKQK
jgi:hypothetical protein